MNSYKIGVISDTHIPDRTPALDPLLLDGLKTEKVDLIFHAGDISVERVLTELEKMAPVIAVRGNRDFLIRKKVAMLQKFEKFGVKIAVMHGHMNFFTYWIDKLIYFFRGYDRNRYASRLAAAAPEVSVYVFGHTHHAENFWQGGKLFFNPGSVSYGDYLSRQCSWGILEILEDGRVESRIIPL